MMLTRSITILWGKVATALAFLSGRNLRMNCVLKRSSQRHDDWIEHAKNCFYGNGSMLNSEGKCIYNIRHKEDPLPIEKMIKAVKAVKDGDFIPDSGNDE